MSQRHPSWRRNGSSHEPRAKRGSIARCHHHSCPQQLHGSLQGPSRSQASPGGSCSQEPAHRVERTGERCLENTRRRQGLVIASGLGKPYLDNQRQSKRNRALGGLPRQVQRKGSLRQAPLESGETPILPRLQFVRLSHPGP